MFRKKKDAPKEEVKEMAVDPNIENNFTYHKPKSDQVGRYNLLRELGKDFASQIKESCPDTRERSLAITKVEEAVMWGISAIARNE